MQKRTDRFKPSATPTEYLRALDKPAPNTSCWPHHHFMQVDEPRDPLGIRPITRVRLFCTQCGTTKEIGA